MRKHRIYGVVIAVLVGSIFMDRPSSSHHANSVDIRRTEYRLASAALPVDTGYIAPVVTYGGTTFSLWSPPGPHRADALWSYKASLTEGPPAPPAPPPPPPVRPPVTKAASGFGSAAPAVVEVAHTVRPTVIRPTVIRPTPAPKPASSVPGAAGTPAGGVWAALRRCESGGDYAEDTGNGYYGAYQFSLSTWRGLGLPGLPSEASPAAQDAAARALQSRSGWGQWPACSSRLGLL